VSPGFASRTATGYAPALAQVVTPSIATSTATAYAPSLNQYIATDAALRTATAYDVTLAQYVTPNAALRTATGYDTVFPLTVLPSFASSTATAYATTILQYVTPDTALRTATAYTPTISQYITPDAALRTATAYAPTLSQYITPNAALRTATAYTVTLISNQFLSTGFAGRTATAYAVSIAQNVTATFASSTAAAYAVTLNQFIFPTPALRTATAYTVSFLGAQVVQPSAATRTATAYPVAINQTVTPNFASRTALAYSATVVLSQSVEAGFASRTSVAYAPTINTAILAGFAASTAVGYAATVVNDQVVNPTPASRTATAFATSISQTVLPNIASRIATAYPANVIEALTVLPTFAERTATAFDPSVFVTTVQTLIVDSANRSPSAYPPKIQQKLNPGFARSSPYGYAVTRLKTGVKPKPIPPVNNVYEVPIYVNNPPKNFPKVRRALVRRSSTKSLLLRWSILPTDYDMSDVRFVVFRSQGNAGPWTQIGVAEEGAFHFVDHDVNSPWSLSSFYYILRTISIKGAGYVDSDPLYCSHDADHIAQELVRKKQVYLRARAGVNVAFLCRKSWGTKCARCWDEVRKIPTDPECPDCYGTGYAGGYLNAFHTLALITPAKEIEIAGKFRDGTIYAEIGPDPYVDPGDVLVDVTMNLRYRITAVQQASHRQYVVSQILTLVQCDENDVVYKVPIKEPLESRRGESYAVVGAGS
jgi:hypothetical protein